MAYGFLMVSLHMLNIYIYIDTYWIHIVYIYIYYTYIYIYRIIIYIYIWIMYFINMVYTVCNIWCMYIIYIYFISGLQMTCILPCIWYMAYGFLMVSLHMLYIHGLDTLEEMVWADLSQLNTWDEKWRAKIVGSDGRKMITGRIIPRIITGYDNPSKSPETVGLS